MFLLFISGTEISKIPGLSAAGANVELIQYTALADADVLRYGVPKIIDAVPVDPEGRPTPALITRAACLESGFPSLVVRAGTWLPPLPPYCELGGSVGRNARFEPAVPDAAEIFERAFDLGRSLGAATEGPLVLAESIPGGTSTALLLLNAFGYEGMVSSASAQNPIQLKEQLWRDASTRSGIGFGDGKGRGLEVVAQMGDPMQAAVAGFVMGVPSAREIVLAGGSQMLAVAALLKDLGLHRLPLIATTRYVVEDKSACFNQYAASIGLPVWSAQLDFSKSPHKGLADYEQGYVKEGVGAGGSVWYAERLGVSVERIVRRTEQLYADLMGLKS